MDDTDSKSNQAGLKAELFGANLKALRPLVEAVACVSADPQPPGALQARLSERIAADAGGVYVSPPPRQWQEPEWNEVGAGIFCKLLTADTERHVVGMLVRLAPGAHYPPHLHAGVEELHLLDGELWIGTRKLHPGDYNRAEPGTGDRDVWSETGCVCVLITSTDDVLG
jgi:anti-sigma factor ChrR (cupin superfamily)